MSVDNSSKRPDEQTAASDITKKAKEEVDFKKLPKVILQSALVSLIAAVVDFALLYLLCEKLGLNFNIGVVSGKIVGAIVKYLLFVLTSFSLNRVMYKESRIRFLIVTGLSVLFAVTLINLSVLYAGQTAITSWLILTPFAWFVTNVLVILFGKLLLIIGKSSISSFTATSVDFMIFNAVLMIIGNELYAAANLVSKFIGATTNFTIHKYWAFNVRGGGYGKQYGRYLLISLVSYLLNTGIIKVCVDYLGLNPRLGWPIAGFIVWLGWNFVMTRYFVFKLPVFHDNRKEK